MFHPDSLDMSFAVHHPKDASDEALDTLQQHIKKFEKFIKAMKTYEPNDLGKWLDINECTRHYWVQEFTKNPDAKGYSSLYFTWVKCGPIRMGPEWDFDLAFGGHNNDTTNQSDNMYIKIGYWHSYIFRDFDAAKSRVYYWRENIISVNGLVINKSNIP
ncbi:CotH kinase family protein [Fibrobacter succinogenes]|uniref:CotH kinase family protein n=1 Tax=Fibrobacter succinogenes TaxID=833 RepID=UPI0015699F4D|nr:CotH kinase family protein [Fibrobacter succinogenes]